MDSVDVGMQQTNVSNQILIVIVGTTHESTTKILLVLRYLFLRYRHLVSTHVFLNIFKLI